MSTTADLERVGLGRRALDPVSPAASWADVRTSARSILKASRAVLVVEHLAVRLGLPPSEAERIRPVLYVMACAVYDWDAAAESAIDPGEEKRSQERLRGVVADVLGGEAPPWADLDGLTRLAEAERAALAGNLPAVAAFRGVSRWRSCDLRLMLGVIGSLHGWSPALVETVGPLLDLFEVDDDLGSTVEDARAGSYNSWLVLRRELSHVQAREFLGTWAQERSRLLVERLALLPPADAARVEALLLYPFDPGRTIALRALRRSPSSARRRVHRLLGARLAGFLEDPLSSLPSAVPGGAPAVAPDPS